MWEMVSFAAGMVVFMLLFALLPLVFDLPDAIVKYFSRKAQQPEQGPPPSDPDEAAARALGEGLRRAELSSEAAAEVTTVFWAAVPRCRSRSAVTS